MSIEDPVAADLCTRVFADIQGNVCVRRFYEKYADAAIPLGIVLASPWHVEGQDVTASKAAYDAAQAAGATTAGAKATVLADPQRQALLAALRGATNAQIDTYINNNVVDLASARTMLARVVKVLALMV